MSKRCWATIASRTSGWTETRDAAADTSGARIASVTVSPSSVTPPSAIAIWMRCASSPIRAGSSRSAPARRAASATHRYIAPESRYVKPRARAAPLATVDFPAPAGPSMAMTMIPAAEDRVAPAAGPIGRKNAELGHFDTRRAAPQSGGARLRAGGSGDRHPPAGGRAAPGASGARARLAGCRDRGDRNRGFGRPVDVRRARPPGCIRSQRAPRGPRHGRRPAPPLALPLAGPGPPQPALAATSQERVQVRLEARVADRRRVHALDLDALARGQPRDSAQHREAVVPVGLQASAAWRAGPVDGEAVLGRLDLGADRPQAVDDGRDPVRLLVTQLARPRHDRGSF